MLLLRKLFRFAADTGDGSDWSKDDDGNDTWNDLLDSMDKDGYYTEDVDSPIYTDSDGNEVDRYEDTDTYNKYDTTNPDSDASYVSNALNPKDAWLKPNQKKLEKNVHKYREEINRLIDEMMKNGIPVERNNLNDPKTYAANMVLNDLLGNKSALQTVNNSLQKTFFNTGTKIAAMNDPYASVLYYGLVSKGINPKDAYDALTNPSKMEVLSSMIKDAGNTWTAITLPSLITNLGLKGAQELGKAASKVNAVRMMGGKSSSAALEGLTNLGGSANMVGTAGVDRTINGLFNHFDTPRNILGGVAGVAAGAALNKTGSSLEKSNTPTKEPESTTNTVKENTPNKEPESTTNTVKENTPTKKSESTTNTVKENTPNKKSEETLGKGFDNTDQSQFDNTPDFGLSDAFKNYYNTPAKETEKAPEEQVQQNNDTGSDTIETTVQDAPTGGIGQDTYKNPNNDNKSFGLGEEDPNRANYDRDDWNRGMETVSTDVVSDERVKRFIGKSYAKDPVLIKAVKIIKTYK